VTETEMVRQMVRQLGCSAQGFCGGPCRFGNANRCSVYEVERCWFERQLDRLEVPEIPSSPEVCEFINIFLDGIEIAQGGRLI